MKLLVSKYRSGHYDPTPERRAQVCVQLENVSVDPTVLELAGGTPPNYTEGNSFASVLKGKKTAWKPAATYYRYWMHPMHHDVSTHFGIRTKDYKLVFILLRVTHRYE